VLVRDLPPQGVKPLSLQRVQDEGLRRLVQLCTSYDPKDRPEARVLLKHPFFENLRQVEFCTSGSTVGTKALGSYIGETWRISNYERLLILKESAQLNAPLVCILLSHSKVMRLYITRYRYLES